MSTSSGKIRANIINELYTGAELETLKPQEMCILHKDTIRSFMHEIKGKLFQIGSFLGLLGIEITIIITLITSNFKDFWFLKKDLIFYMFIFSSILFGALLIKSGIYTIRNCNTCSPDKLTDELGSRGSILKTKNTNYSSETTSNRQ